MSTENQKAAEPTKADDVQEKLADALYDGGAKKVEADVKDDKVDAEKPADKVEDKPVDGKSEEKVEAKKDQDDKDSEDKGKPEAPEKYEFEVDDDSPVTDDQLDKIAQIAKEQGLSQEQAQKLVDLQEDALKSMLASNKELVDTKMKEWESQSQNDKEFGGEAFNKNVELAKRVVDRFGSDEFKKAVNESGLGNHPELLRVFVRIGKSMSEDGLVLPGNQDVKTKSYEDLFYGGN